MKNAIKFLSVAALLFFSTHEQLRADEKKNAGRDSNFSGKMLNSNSSSLNETMGNYPFAKSTSPIENEKVIGIRAEEGKITILGRENNFYSRPETGENFFNINFFSQYPNLLSVEIKNITLSSQNLENICNFISSNNIKNLIFDSCVIEEKDAKYIANTIRKLNSLIAVTIKFIRTTDEEKKIAAVSPETIEEITQAISEKQNLVSLNVAFDKINAASCEHINSAMEQSENITQLSLCWDEFVGDAQSKPYGALLKTLSELKNLETFCLSMSSVPEESIDTLFKNISALQNLKNLTLIIGNLKDSKKVFEHSSYLAKTIGNLASLSDLRLQNMELPASATQPIMQSIKKLPKLTYFDVSGNKIDKQGGVILGDSLTNTPELKTLIMRNCDISPETAAEISKSLPLTSIAILCLGNNKIKSGIRNLQPNKYPHLRCIDLAMNEITDEDVMLFIENSLSHEVLQIADLRNNCHITGEQRDSIARMKSEKKSTIAYLMDYNLPK